MERIEEHLTEHGVKPTAVRILVWEQASRQQETFTLSDMEGWMPHMDRSSIFRALRLFAEHHLLHEIDDGSGQQKYCVFRCTNSQHLIHTHFTCLQCGQTSWLEDNPILLGLSPEGFDMESA